MQDSKKTILESFDPNWLALRYEYDSQARNSTIEAKCLQYFNTLSHLNLVDVGAGTGSNCLYLLQQLSQDQHWFLLDHNPLLLQAAKQQFLHRITNFQFQLIEEKENRLSWTESGKKITVEFHCGLLQKIATLIPIETIDLIAANAVFDLFTLEEFKDFAQAICEHKIPFYTTINYSKMSFYPNSKKTKFYLDYYEQHMQRSLPQGQPMGKTVTKNLQQLFTSKGYEVAIGESNWELASEADSMFRYLLKFMESSIPELLTEKEQLDFKNWLTEKKKQVKHQKLSGKVGHFDIWATINKDNRNGAGLE